MVPSAGALGTQPGRPPRFGAGGTGCDRAVAGRLQSEVLGRFRRPERKGRCSTLGECGAQGPFSADGVLRRWLAAGIAAALALTAWFVLAALGARVDMDAPPAALVVRSCPGALAPDRLDALLAAYSRVGDPCWLPSAEELAEHHGVSYRLSSGARLDRPAPKAPWADVDDLGISVLWHHMAGRDRPWVALVPEYHEHEESEALTTRLAEHLRSALEVAEVHVLLEAWNNKLEVKDMHHGQVISGLEDMDLYPVSRACWDIMARPLSDKKLNDGAKPHMADAAWLDQHKRRQRFVGEHPSEAEAERALARYAETWNALVQSVFGEEVGRVSLLASAGVRRQGRWIEARRLLRLAVPAASGQSEQYLRLHRLAQSVAAITSRMRTADYAFGVLDLLAQHRGRVALVLVGATHVQPFIDLLVRAGANAAILVTPRAEKWLDTLESWRCPLRLRAGPTIAALGHFRLPDGPAEWPSLPLREVLGPAGERLSTSQPPGERDSRLGRAAAE